MAEKKRRGFAGMDASKQRQIASKGGRAAHQKGTAHEFSHEEARAAGRKGGLAAHERGTAHKFTPKEAQAAGRKGGLAARQKARAAAEAQPAMEQELSFAAGNELATPVAQRGQASEDADTRSYPWSENAGAWLR
jgi:general stress protein YciG